MDLSLWCSTAYMYMYVNLYEMLESSNDFGQPVKARVQKLSNCLESLYTCTNNYTIGIIVNYVACFMLYFHCMTFAWLKLIELFWSFSIVIENHFWTWFWSFWPLFISLFRVFAFLTDQQHEQPMEFTFSCCWNYRTLQLKKKKWFLWMWT